MELPDRLVLPLPGTQLRAFQEDDWPLDQALSRVADVTRWTYYPADLGAEAAHARVVRSLALRADGRGGRFVVEHAGAAVGMVGLVQRVDDPSVYYALLPAGRGKGLATEAVRAVTRWALEHGADTVHAATMVGNTASERVLERLRFRRGGLDVEPDGVTVRRWSLSGEPQPTVE